MRADSPLLVNCPSRRSCRLHPEIVKRLIPYMERVRAEQGDGPLFRHLPKDKNGKRSTYVARKIDEWMDGVIKDPNHGGYSIEFGNAEHLAPNHSFRHYLKSELLARDVPERISDAISGHKTPGIGRKYEACGNVKEIRGDQQAAGDTPPGGVGAKDRERGSPVSAKPQLPDGTKAPIANRLVPAN